MERGGFVDTRLKLEASCSEAERLGCDVGANCWFKLSLHALPPANLVRRWIAESHALYGGARSRVGTSSRSPASKRSKT